MNRPHWCGGTARLEEACRPARARRVAGRLWVHLVGRTRAFVSIVTREWLLALSLVLSGQSLTFCCCGVFLCILMNSQLVVVYIQNTRLTHVLSFVRRYHGKAISTRARARGARILIRHWFSRISANTHEYSRNAHKLPRIFGPAFANIREYS